MTALYRRAASLTIAKPTGFFSQGNSAFTIRDLRILFDLEKTLKSDPNPGSVTVFNLSEETRAAFETKPLNIRLEAGYENNLRRIFQGDLRYSRSTKQGASWRTDFELGEGLRAYRFSRVNRSFRGGTNRAEAVREVARSMGLNLAVAAQTALTVSDFVTGVSLYGPARKQLDQLLKSQGYDWSVQGNTLTVLRERETVPQKAFTVSEENGMIGSPEFAAPERGKKNPPVIVTSLLYPELVPGGLIKIESRRVNGLFKILTVKHRGDTRGREWYTEVEGTEL